MDKIEILSASNITKAFGEKQVLRGVTLSVARGESVAVLGKSGCGKTTLLNILGGLSRPDSGQIAFCDRVLHRRNLRKYRAEEVGFLFQSSALIEEMTVLENIRVAVMIAKSGEDARKYLKMVDLPELANAQPSQLSGGQAHRVALARALAKKPSVLLLDEPTERLDPQTGQQIMDLLLKACREENIATVVVTHRKEHALQTDRCFVLRDGVLTEGAEL